MVLMLVVAMATTDEACIMSLLEDVKTLQNKVGQDRLLPQEGGASLSAALEMWRKLYLSLAECLSARHGLSLSNMYSGTQPMYSHVHNVLNMCSVL